MTVTSATIRVAAGNAGALAEASETLSQATRSLARESSAASIEFTLTAGRSAAERRQFGRVMDMIRGIKDHSDHDVDKLQVSYISPDAGRQVVDLLGDDVTVFRDIEVDPARRFVTPEQANEAILGAYNGAIDQLNAALALG